MTLRASVLGDSVVSIGMHLAEDEPGTLKAEYGPTPLQEELRHASAEQPKAQSLLTPFTSPVCDTDTRGYSALIEIQYQLMGKPFGALRYFDGPSRHTILNLVAQVLTEAESPQDPTRFIKTLNVFKGDTSYDILGYPEVNIRSLLDYVSDFEKLLGIRCVYGI